VEVEVGDEAVVEVDVEEVDQEEAVEADKDNTRDCSEREEKNSYRNMVGMGE
jgi:hypothetical protein